MATLPFLPFRGQNMLVDGQNLGRVLESAKVPVNQDAYDDFSPATANGTIAVAVSSDALELGFKTKGVQPELLGMCNDAFGVRRKITLLGALVNEYAETTDNRAIQVQATVWGRLNAEVGDAETKTVTATEYTVKSILKYTLRIGGKEICRFDLLRGGWLDKHGQRVEIAQMIAATGA